MNNGFNKGKIEKLTLGALLTALVILLQILGSFIKLGAFSVSLVLIPIVIGAAVCGVGIGAWLGLVFGAAVLISGDAALFFTINPFGTVVTVLFKGFLCGLASGLTFEALRRKNENVAVFSAAAVCPIVNTGVFVLGTFLFFLDGISAWEGVFNAVQFVFTGLIGFNFFFELAVNLILAPIIVKLLKLSKLKF